MNKAKRSVLALAVFLAVIFTAESVILPCAPPPLPPFCPRTVYLAKFVPWGSIPIPGDGSDIKIPIGILPYAGWNSLDPRCAQPVSATLTFTITCVPVGGGTPIVIGPQVFSMATPVSGGEQRVPGDTVTFVIPGGLIAPGSVTQICTVVGSYSVTFAGGVGFGVVTGSGDTEFYLTPPSPVAPELPRLEMHYLDLETPIPTFRRGDQGLYHFLLANNDPFNSVTLTLSSEGRQAAVLPDGFTADDAYAAGIFSISNPAQGVDVSPAVFAENLLPGGIIPLPDPFVSDPLLITKTLTLAPGEAQIVSMAMRSHGMCLDGSCNERDLRAAGSFSNGDTALACASALYLVGDVPGQTPLCEIIDSVKVGDFMDVIWGRADYTNGAGTLQHASTFFPGNLAPDDPRGPGFQTRGVALGDTIFPPSGFDMMRTEIQPEIVAMSLTGLNVQDLAGQPVTNNVQILGIDQHFNGTPEFQVPFIGFNPPQPNPVALDIIFDLPLNQLVILDGPNELFNGPIDIFLADPPPPLIVDPTTCRTFRKVADILEKSIIVLPPSVSKLFNENDAPGSDTLDVFDNLTATLTDWAASATGSGVTLPLPSGFGELPLGFDLTSLPLFPQTTISEVSVTSVGASNNPVVVPVAMRVLPDISTFSMGIKNGWNLIARPLNVSDSAVGVLFPTHTLNSLFSYNGSYQLETFVRGCEGFWLNFPADQTVSISGSIQNSCWINLNAGWNLIGGPSCAVPVSAISDPGGVLVGSIFGFDGAYFSASFIEPGQGYWAFASGPGDIHITCAGTAKAGANLFAGAPGLSEQNALSISDAAGASQTLYFNVDLDEIGDEDAIDKAGFRLPPIPPAPLFDARFSDDFLISGDAEARILIQTDQYPLAIAAENLTSQSNARFVIHEMIGNQVVASHDLQNGKAVQISNPLVKKLKLSQATASVPTEFQVRQNYPNPFNPSTTIQYDLPEKTDVQIVIYNTIGQVVRTLLSQTVGAGFHQVEWNGKDDRGNSVTSGIYIYRIVAGESRQSRKMVLLR